MQSILTHPLRSLNRVLGFSLELSVWFGCFIGEGIADQAEGEIMELGANNLIVSSKDLLRKRVEQGCISILMV